VKLSKEEFRRKLDLSCLHHLVVHGQCGQHYAALHFLLLMLEFQHFC
jgi:hypothetical protein